MVLTTRSASAIPATVSALHHPQSQSIPEIIPGSANSLPRGLYTFTTSHLKSNPRKRPRDLMEEISSKRSRHSDSESPSDGRSSRLGFQVTLGSYSDSSTLCEPSDSNSLSGGLLSKKEDTAAYVAALYGFEQQASGYECGSGSDSDDEPPSPSHDSVKLEESDAGSELDTDTILSDISEDAFNAEIDCVLNAPRLINHDDYDGDVDLGSDSDSDSDEEQDTVVVEQKLPRNLAWIPRPSPLRHSHDLESLVDDEVARTPVTERSGRTRRYPRGKDLRKEVQSTQFMEALLEYSHIDPLTENICISDACVDAGPDADSGEDASKTTRILAGRDNTLEVGDVDLPGTGEVDEDDDVPDHGDFIYIDDDADGEVSGEEECDDNDEDESKEEEPPMGRGTPPGICFSLRPILEPPPSPYTYSIRDEFIPLRRLTQTAFYGDRSWATLLRQDRAADSLQDTEKTRVVHSLIIGVGETMRVVEMRTSRKAMCFWREHQEQVATLWMRGRGETTATIIEEFRITKTLLEGRGAPSPESMPSRSDAPITTAW